ncbi:hypothetical protein ACI65C_006054 [Semiaphis heraclei]
MMRRYVTFRTTVTVRRALTDDENVVYDKHHIRASMPPPRLLRSKHYYFPITCALGSPPYPVITIRRREYIIFECYRCSAERFFITDLRVTMFQTKS